MEAETNRSVAIRMLTQLSVLLVFVVAVGFLWAVRSLVVLFVASVILSLGIAPLVDFIQRIGLRKRGLAVIAAMLSLAVLLALLGFLLLPSLINQTVSFVGNLPGLVGDIGRNAKLQNYIQQYHLTDYTKQLQDRLPQFLSGGASVILSTTISALNIVANIVIVGSLTFFLLLEGPSMWEQLLELSPARDQSRIRKMGEKIRGAVEGYVTGNLFTSLIAGTVAWMIMMLLHIPYALPLAVLVGLFDLVPLVGSQAAAVIVALVGLSGGWAPAVLALLLLNIYQLIENNYLQPLVYGRAVRIPPLIALVATLAGAQVYGLVGVLMAIPIASAIQIVIVDYLADHRHSNDK